MARQTVLLYPLVAATILAGVMVGIFLGTKLVAERDGAEGSDVAASEVASEAESAIFMMGDGMGQAHRDAIQLATVGAYGRLEMDKLPVEGMVGTNAADPDELVTDSAAGATSFATGVKTSNDAIGVDAEGREVANIAERAKAAGKSVGLVTTSQITDASPAAFASHVGDRTQQSEIARQYLEETELDVILGGGKNLWYPPGADDIQPGGRSANAVKGARGSEGNLVARARELGYDYVTNQDELEQASGEKVLGLFANEKMFQPGPEGEGAYELSVPLSVMTRKAIELLSRDPQGYFLFVEEEATDAMSHHNNAPLTIEAGQALDEAVGVARRLADEKTLLVVTADHECGGLVIERSDLPTLPDESGGNQGNDEADISVEDGPFDVVDADYEFVMDWTTTGHTAVDVPLTAQGPGATLLTGNHENTEVHDAIADALGVER